MIICNSSDLVEMVQILPHIVDFFAEKRKMVEILILFTSCTSNLVMKDISLAYQMVKDMSWLGLISFDSIEWESLSFSSGASGCGLLPENCSVAPHEGFRWPLNHPQ